MEELSSLGSVSPSCIRIVTFQSVNSNGFIHNLGLSGTIQVWDASNGRHAAWTLIANPHAPPPLDITFDSEDRFYLHDNTHRVPYVIRTTSRTGNPPIHWITRREGQQLEGQVLEESYCLDDGCEWAFCGSQRVCWVPPGYIRRNHCWAGSSLVMVGEGGTLRMLTFLKSSL